MISKLRMYFRKFPVIYSILRSINVEINKIKNIKINRFLEKKYTNILENYTSKGNTVWYLCVPIHNNLGDQAQKICIKEWLKINFHEKKVIEIPGKPFIFSNKFRKLFLSKIKGEDIIVFQSGYTSTDLHDDEFVHRFVAEKCVNKIIFFPQTVNFSNENQCKFTADLYNKHGNIVFLARDTISFDLAKANFYNIKVMKYPDIVTTMIGENNFEIKEREGILLCFRNDSEKKISDKEIKLLNSELSNYGKLTLKDTSSDTNENFEKEFYNMINDFSRYKVIITDRFHGTIFSIITNTPVIVLPTTDYKVTEGAKWFVGRYNNVFSVNSVKEIKDLIDKIFDDYKVIETDNYFRNMFYEELPIIINKGE